MTCYKNITETPGAMYMSYTIWFQVICMYVFHVVNSYAWSASIDKKGWHLEIDNIDL